MCHCTSASVSRGGDDCRRRRTLSRRGACKVAGAGLERWPKDISWRLARSLAIDNERMLTLQCFCHRFGGNLGPREDDRPVDHPSRSPVGRSITAASALAVPRRAMRAPQRVCSCSYDVTRLTFAMLLPARPPSSRSAAPASCRTICQGPSARVHLLTRPPRRSGRSVWRYDIARQCSYTAVRSARL
jgi:hypothetical protein